MPFRLVIVLALLFGVASACNCGDPPAVGDEDAGIGSGGGTGGGTGGGIGGGGGGGTGGGTGGGIGGGGGGAGGGTGGGSGSDGGELDGGDDGGLTLDGGELDGGDGPGDGGSGTGCGDSTGLQPNAPWPMRGRCPTRISRADVPGPSSGNVRWQVELGTFPTNPAIVSAPAVDSSGTVYFGVQPVGSEPGGLYALHPDGGTRWFHSTASSAVSSGAIITAQDKVVFTSNAGKVISLELDGGLFWDRSLGATVVSSPYAGPDGTIYISDQNGVLHGLDPATGQVKWTRDHSVSCGAMAGGVTQGSDGYLWIGCSATVWREPPSGPDAGLATGFLVTSPGLVRAPVTIGAAGTVWVGASTGELVVANQLGGVIRRTNFASQGSGHFYNGPAAAADGTMYFTAPGVSDTVDNVLYASLPDGGYAALRSFDAGVLAQVSVDGAGQLYVIAGTVLHALGPDAGTRWARQLGDGVQKGVAFGADGTLYVGTTGGRIFAIGP